MGQGSKLRRIREETAKTECERPTIEERMIRVLQFVVDDGCCNSGLRMMDNFRSGCAEAYCRSQGIPFNEFARCYKCEAEAILEEIGRSRSGP